MNGIEDQAGTARRGRGAASPPDGASAPATPRPVRRWPLVLIAAPAAVAIWSGWVGLGELCGFGPVRLLPGITGWTLNTAITLPIGVEAYAAYALGAWMPPDLPPGARPGEGRAEGEAPVTAPATPPGRPAARAGERP